MANINNEVIVIKIAIKSERVSQVVMVAIVAQLVIRLGSVWRGFVATNTFMAIRIADNQSLIIAMAKNIVY